MGFLSEREANKKKAAAQREADMEDAPDLLPSKPASGLMADRKAGAAKAEATRKAQMDSAPDIGPKRPAAGIMAERNDNAKRADDKRKAQMADAPNVGPTSPESYLADRSFNAASAEATRTAQMADVTDLLPYIQIAIDRLSRDPLTPQAKSQLASLKEFGDNIKQGLAAADTSIKDSNARIGTGLVKKITDTVDKTPLVDNKTKQTLKSISTADTTFKDASAEIGQTLASALNSMKDSAAKEVADAIIAVAPAAAVSAPILAAAPYLRATVRNHFVPLISEAGANPSGTSLPVDAKGMSMASGKPITTKIANPVAPDAGLESINPEGMANSRASNGRGTKPLPVDPKGMAEARASKGLMKPSTPDFPNASPETYYKDEAVRINPTEAPAKPAAPSEAPSSSKGVNSADYYKPEAKSIAGDTKPGLMKPPVEASVAAEAPAASAEPPKFMITKADKAALNHLGYSIEEIRQMTPKEAQTIIDKGVVNAGSQVDKSTSFVKPSSTASSAPVEATAEATKKPFFTRNPPVTSNTTLWEAPPTTAGANEAKGIPTSPQQMKMTEGTPAPANVNAEGSTLRSANAANSNAPGEAPPSRTNKLGPSFPEPAKGTNAFARGAPEAKGFFSKAADAVSGAASEVMAKVMPAIRIGLKYGSTPAAIVAELASAGDLNKDEAAQLKALQESGELARIMENPETVRSNPQGPAQPRAVTREEAIPDPAKPRDQFAGNVLKDNIGSTPSSGGYTSKDLADIVYQAVQSSVEDEAFSRGVPVDQVIRDRMGSVKGLMAPSDNPQLGPEPGSATPSPRPEPQAATLAPEPQAATPSPEPSAAKLPPPRTAQEGAAAQAAPAATRLDIAPMAPSSTPTADTAPTAPVQSNTAASATPVAAPMQMPSPGPSQGTPAATPAPSNAPRQMPMPDNRQISVEQANKSFTADNPLPYGDQHANLQTMLEAMADGSFGGGRVEAFRLNGMNFTYDPAMPSKYRITK